MLCAMAALEDVSPAPLSDAFYGKQQTRDVANSPSPFYRPTGQGACQTARACALCNLAFNVGNWHNHRPPLPLCPSAPPAAHVPAPETPGLDLEGPRWHRALTVEEQEQGIFIGEVRALVETVENFAPEISGHTVRFMEDNQAAMYATRRLTSKHPVAMPLLRRLWALLCVNRIRLQDVDYVRSAENPADEPSRWRSFTPFCWCAFAGTLPTLGGVFPSRPRSSGSVWGSSTRSDAKERAIAWGLWLCGW